jgi:3-methyladenine DNA glycosylase AlkC
MQKEFGKFTTVQIREFIEFIPQIQKDRSEYLADLRNNPHKLNESMSEPLKWSWTYELPINEHIARLAMECGEGENLIEMSIADDPQQAVLDDMKCTSSDLI